MRPGRGEIISLNLSPLVLIDGRRSEGVRGLEPGTRIIAGQVCRVGVGKLKVGAIEDVLLVALRVNHLKLRRIEEPTGVEPAGGDEVAPLRGSIREIEAGRRAAKRTVGGSQAAGRLCLPQTGTRGDLDHQARLISILGGRRA